jgi:hypothetical protein
LISSDITFIDAQVKISQDINDLRTPGPNNSPRIAAEELTMHSESKTGAEPSTSCMKFAVQVLASPFLWGVALITWMKCFGEGACCGDLHINLYILTSFTRNKG